MDGMSPHNSADGVVDGRKPVQRPNISAGSFCTILGIGNFVQGGVVGGAVGSIHAIADGFTTGIRHDPGFGRYVVQAGVSSAASFGVWLGVFTSSKCVLKLSRGKSDLFNSFWAGTSAGMASSLRTRNPRIIAVSGLASGVLMTALDAFGGTTKHSGV